MSKKTIILISGKAGSGKSTKAKLIKELLGSKVEMQSFANAVKSMGSSICMDFYGVNTLGLSPEEKEQFRPVLQAIGGVGRAINENYWVNKTKEIISIMGQDIVVIDDCRFENELNAFDGFNVIKIRLNRTSANRNVNQDSSETGLDHIAKEDWDFVFTDEDSNRTFASLIIGTLENLGAIEETLFGDWREITDVVNKFEAELC